MPKGIYKHKQLTEVTKKKLSMKNSGERSATWKGGKTKSTWGYILMMNKSHPNANASGYVFEHRLVMEKKLGRFIESNEIVHHLNNIKTDNSPENLVLMNRKTHASKHHLNAKRSKEIKEKLRESIIKGYRNGRKPIRYWLGRARPDMIGNKLGIHHK